MLIKTNGGFLMGKIRQIGGRVFERLLAEYGVDQFNGPQGRILYVLWENDNIPISALSEKTGLAKTTLTSMLDRMEASGQVQRVCDPADRRKINIRLMESIKGLRASYDEVSDRMSKIFYEGFTDDEIIAFEKQLTRILKNLERKEDIK